MKAKINYSNLVNEPLKHWKDVPIGICFSCNPDDVQIYLKVEKFHIIKFRDNGLPSISIFTSNTEADKKMGTYYIRNDITSISII